MYIHIYNICLSIYIISVNLVCHAQYVKYIYYYINYKKRLTKVNTFTIFKFSSFLFCVDIWMFHVSKQDCKLHIHIFR